MTKMKIMNILKYVLTVEMLALLLYGWTISLNEWIAFVIGVMGTIGLAMAWAHGSKAKKK